MRDDLVMDAPTGDRWRLAIDLLRDGGGQVRFGSLHLARWIGFPTADEKIHIGVRALSGTAPHDGAEAAVEQGLGQLRELRAANAKLDMLLDEIGVAVEYVYDYDNGAVTLGVIQNGQLAWTAA
jgi:hypothetical protein